MAKMLTNIPVDVSELMEDIDGTGSWGEWYSVGRYGLWICLPKQFSQHLRLRGGGDPNRITGYAALPNGDWQEVPGQLGMSVRTYPGDLKGHFRLAGLENAPWRYL